MINLLIKIVMCHIMGDYILKNDWVAQTKGSNWYHLFVHSVSYCVPFAVLFGIDYKLAIVFITHMIIDSLKARYGKITYVQDQSLHYLISLIYFI